jgi:catechol 2,3-dioxygenase-like lactoylglutathione lyase family enzyme
MEVSAIFPSPEGRGRHALIFVKPGDSETWGFHFFERPAANQQQSASSEALPLNSGAGLMLHIAFRLLDDASAQALRERLRHHHIPITEIEALGSFVFHDNNGIMLEATWNRSDNGISDQ